VEREKMVVFYWREVHENPKVVVGGVYDDFE